MTLTVLGVAVLFAVVVIGACAVFAAGCFVGYSVALGDLHAMLDRLEARPR